MERTEMWTTGKKRIRADIVLNGQKVQDNNEGKRLDNQKNQM